MGQLKSAPDGRRFQLDVYISPMICEEWWFAHYTYDRCLSSGERDHGLITECTEAKDQAALISVLFHVKKMEEQFGAPTPYIAKRRIN